MYKGLICGLKIGAGGGDGVTIADVDDDDDGPILICGCCITTFGLNGIGIIESHGFGGTLFKGFGFATFESVSDFNKIRSILKLVGVDLDFSLLFEFSSIFNELSSQYE